MNEYILQRLAKRGVLALLKIKSMPTCTEQIVDLWCSIKPWNWFSMEKKRQRQQQQQQQRQQHLQQKWQQQPAAATKTRVQTNNSVSFTSKSFATCQNFKAAETAAAATAADGRSWALRAERAGAAASRKRAVPSPKRKTHHVTGHIKFSIYRLFRLKIDLLKLKAVSVRMKLP